MEPYDWHIDLAFEVLRSLILAGLMVYLLHSGASRSLYRVSGWKAMISGFGLILLGSLLDITDNFASLSRYVVVGDTVVESFLEKEVGYLLGVLLILVGCRSWLPDVTRRAHELEAEIERREAAEKEARRVEAHLLQSQRRETVGRLVSGVAHDFNNVLTAVLGQSWLVRRELKREEVDRESVQRSVGQIELASRRGEALADQLLIFSRQEHDDPVLLDVGVVLEDLQQMLSRLVPVDVRIEIEVPSAMRRVFADLHQLEQVIVNLVVNARDAMPRGGSIRIDAHNVATQDEDHPDSLGPGDYVRISVADEGSGITPETLEKIYEPFFTTKPAGSGTGLGMATVKRIVEKFDGVVTVETALGVGTTFSVWLPGRDAPATPLPESEAVQPLSGRGQLILVCADDPFVRVLVERVLDQAGYGVRVASHAIAAERLFDEEPGVMLLLTDLIIAGGKRGPELAEALKARRPSLRVLFMSGHGEEALESMGLSSGEGPVLGKPFSIPELLFAIGAALNDSDP